MKDVWVHVLLFLVVSAAFVVISAFYSEAEDGPAFRSMPRRFVYFVLGCAVLAGLMLLFEHTLASVD
jgi:hypothetical protein